MTRDTLSKPATGYETLTTPEASADSVLAEDQFGDDANSTVEKGVSEGHVSMNVTSSFIDRDSNEANDGNTTTSLSSSFWHLIVTLYLPLLVLWFRRTMFGSTYLFRTLIVGQLFCLACLESLSEWVTEKSPSWLVVLCHPTDALMGSPATAGKFTAGSDPHAWPPPAFTALALFTIFTLVVHPDGLTWIMLGKIRDIMQSILSIFGQCGEILMDDYGFFPTIVATLTLGSLVFLVFIVLRTLSPKQKRGTTPPIERKKKKKKGNARRRDHPHRHPATSSSSQLKSNTAVSQQTSTEANISNPSSLACKYDDSVTSISESKTMHGHSSPDALVMPMTMAENTSKTVVSSGFGSKASKCERSRIPSASTVETSLMSDDRSFDSTSNRSHPSISVSSTQSGAGDKINKKKRGGSRRGKIGGDSLSIKPNRMLGKCKEATTAAYLPYGPSRWDALKPAQGNSNGGISFNHRKHGVHHQQHAQHHTSTRARSGDDVNGNKKCRVGHHAKCGKENPFVSSDMRGSRQRNPDFSPKAKLDFSRGNSTGATVSTNQTSVVQGLTSPPPGFQSEIVQVGNHANVSTFCGASTWNGMPLAGSQWENIRTIKDQDVVSALLRPPHVQNNESDWNTPAGNPLFQASIPTCSGQVTFGASIPFSDTTSGNTQDEADWVSQIEADLQELGGQMAGSILDF